MSLVIPKRCLLDFLSGVDASRVFNANLRFAEVKTQPERRKISTGEKVRHSGCNQGDTLY